jgi:L-rhamnose mutarotase
LRGRYKDARTKAHLPDYQGKCVSNKQLALNDRPRYLQLKPEHEAEYISTHRLVWPSVLAALERHNIVDYSIFYHKAAGLLIAVMKYTGEDYERDMADIASDPETQRWWKVMDGMQESLIEGAMGSGKDVPWWLVGVRVSA